MNKETKLLIAILGLFITGISITFTKGFDWINCLGLLGILIYGYFIALYNHVEEKSK